MAGNLSPVPAPISAENVYYTNAPITMTNVPQHDIFQEVPTSTMDFSFLDFPEQDEF